MAELASPAQKDNPRFNLMIIGNTKVGKTSLMSMHCRKKFSADVFSTTGVDFLQTLYTSKDETLCRFKIWDTGGQERFNGLVSSYMKNADGIVFVFDLTCQDSFVDLRDWITRANQQIMLDAAESDDDQNERVPMVIIGNKLDLCKQGNGDSERTV